MAKPAIELDPILAQLGMFGKYHIVNYVFLLLPVFLAGFFGPVYVFEAPDIDYRCHISECAHLQNDSWVKHAIPLTDKGDLSKCTRYPMAQASVANDTQCLPADFNTNRTEACTSIDYGEEYSIVKDFNLGCQNWKRTLVGTIHNGGLFISLPLTGFISDKYGRKIALSVASLMNAIFGVLRSFSVSYEMFLVFEFLETAFGGGAYSSAFIFTMELVGPKGRVVGNAILNIVAIFGAITLPSLAWALQDWRVFLRIAYTPAAFVFFYIWILNESIRWLISKGRTEEAMAIINKAAKMNNVKLSDEVVAPLYVIELEKQPLREPEEEVKVVKEDSNIVKALKSSIILKRLLACSFLWITCTFVYYGMSINSVSLAGNKYVNFMLVVLVEFPGNIVCYLVLDRFGRKRTLISTYVMSACLCISLSFLSNEHKWWSLFLYLLGKFSITVAYSTVYIYVSEVFPTSVRQSMLAVCSSLGRIGSTLAPQTPLLAYYYDNLPAIFFGGMALIASLFVFTLPETNNTILPDTIEEAERISRRNPRNEES